jgi:hypothetical protein
MESDWRTWTIEDSLKKTDTYDILYNEIKDLRSPEDVVNPQFSGDTKSHTKMETVEFSSPKDLCNFIKYCEYMMFSSFREPHPISEEECRDYFRSLYKYVEMVYEENILEARQQSLAKNQ